MASTTPKRRLTDFFSPSTSKASGSRSISSPCLRKPLFDTELTPSRKKRKFSVDLDPKQQTLDAGQRLIGMQNCRQCGMVYSIDDMKDVEEHTRFHNRSTDLAVVRVLPNILQNWKKSFCYTKEPGRYLFSVRSCEDQSSLRNRVERIVEEMVNGEVGFCPDLSVWGQSRSRMAFVCVMEQESKWFISGILLVDLLYSAVWYDGIEKFSSTEPLLGVNRIWTHAIARRKGVAQSLLNYARTRLVLGSTVSKELVVFSVPTDVRHCSLKLCGERRQELSHLSTFSNLMDDNTFFVFSSPL